jgi:hypothetical protein
MKNRIILFISTTIPIVTLSTVFFGGCDGFYEKVKTSSSVVALSMVLIPAFTSAISIVVSLILFFKIYGTPTRNGVLCINQRTATSIASGIALFIFLIHFISDSICN